MISETKLRRLNEHENIWREISTYDSSKLSNSIKNSILSFKERAFKNREKASFSCIYCDIFYKFENCVECPFTLCGYRGHSTDSNMCVKNCLAINSPYYKLVNLEFKGQKEFAQLCLDIATMHHKK